jgi:hypothetical protein
MAGITASQTVLATIAIPSVLVAVDLLAALR